MISFANKPIPVRKGFFVPALIPGLMLILSVALFNTEYTNAQTAAPPGIFQDTVYQSVKITSDIVYGSNFNHFYNKAETLKLDTYEPDSVVDYLRPLIIYLHGGGFTAGDKTTDKAVVFGNHFARCGYLYASINYRLYIDDPGDTIDNFQGVYMCTQDAKSAVRFFRKHASEYCVDTSQIFMIGTSAGAAICLNTAYFDQDEANNLFDTTGFGTLENSSGNEGFSSIPNGVVACWGGMSDTTWLQDESTPNYLFHGTKDHTVPYVWGLSQNGVYLFGAYTIHEASIANGIESYLHPFVGAGHGVSVNSPEFDTIVWESTDFYYNHLNTAVGSTLCSFSTNDGKGPIEELVSGISITTLNEDLFTIRNNYGAHFAGTVKIFSIMGHPVHISPVSLGGYEELSIDCSIMPPGAYLVILESPKLRQPKKIFVGR